jgi:MFS family permease
MKMAATWFRSGRGLAIGAVVGALTVGKATPYLVHAFPGASVSAIVLTASGAAALATGGYLGHMFELYSFWTWIPAFLAASVEAGAGGAGGAGAGVSGLASLFAFLTIAVGGAGCIWGGLVADRRGREWLVTVAMAASGTCALVIGLFFGASLWLLAPIALAWGFFVIADSAQFSTLVTESVSPHAVGTALTLQTSLGFLLTMVSIQLVPPIAQRVGWRWAFPVLALGPAFGIAAIQRLRSVVRQPRAIAGAA